MKQTGRFIAIAIASLVLVSCIQRATAQGTAFTYQGRLNDGAGPAGGIYDLRITIYDSSGGSTIVAPAATVCPPFDNTRTCRSSRG